MDYKNRIPGYRQPRKKSRSGLWVALGVAGGLATLAFGWITTRHHEETPAALEAAVQAGPKPLVGPAAKGAESKAADKKQAKTETKDPTKPAEASAAKLATPPPVNVVEPRFAFYKILPEKETIIPENEIKQIKQEETQGKKPMVQYTIQAGSFGNPQDAEALRSRLSTLKIKSRIESVKNEITGKTQSLVKIGPFESLSNADAVRTILRSNQIDSVVQRALNKTPPAAPSRH